MSTLRALGKSKRLLPICLMVIPIIGLEWVYGNDPAGVGIVILMGILFPTLAPILWRALLSQSRSLWPLRLSAYALLGVAAVFITGRLLPHLLHMNWTLITDPPSLVAALVIFWVGGWSLGRDIDLETSLQFQMEQNRIIAKEAAHAQIMAMERHLDPHFIFNTLNAIAEWCTEDAKVAEQATIRLSVMLRTIFKGFNHPTWPISQELALVDDLIALYQIRDPEKFTIEQQVTLPDTVFWVPPMVLLLVAENAIKHGPWAGHEGPIRFLVEPHGGNLHIIFSNPGPYNGPRPGSHGLQMLRRRLELAYQGAARWQIVSQGERTAVEMELPPLEGDYR